MMPTDYETLDLIAAVHVKARFVCGECERAWPCRTRVLLDRAGVPR